MPDLKSIVEKLHDCRAELVVTEHVEETHDGQIVWTGEVSTYKIDGNQTDTCFAWVEQDERPRYYAVLKVDPIRSASDAVRASIAKEYGDVETLKGGDSSK